MTLRTISLIACTLLIGCDDDDRVPCLDFTCDPDQACDEAHGVCVSPDQLVACEGLAEGDDCHVEDFEGDCLDGVCVRLACGDGRVDPPEECDLDGTTDVSCVDLGYYDDGPVECTRDCLFDTSLCTGICGDGITNGPEQCDQNDLGGFNCTDFGSEEPDGLACNQICAYDTSGCQP